MTRTLFGMLIIALASTLVGAQTPVALTPGQRADLFKKNRTVIRGIVDRTVASAQTSNDYILVADSYYPLLLQFNRELQQARLEKDSARVQELSRLLEILLDRGLAPTLVEARKQVEGGSHAEDYPKIKSQLLSQLQALTASLGNDELAKSALQKARERLDQIESRK